MKLEHPTPAQLPQLKALWQECFGDDMEFIDSYFALAYDARRCLCIRQDGQVLAAAHWMDCSYEKGRLAYIYAVATGAVYRGRGLCHQLMAAIHSLLLQQGYAGAVLVPGTPALSDLYQKMGYAFFGGKREFCCAPGQTPVPLRQLTAMEYSYLRQQYLPAGAVRQEGAALRFLQHHAKLAAGTDFLLAYNMEQGQLHALELLGEPGAAAGILKTLDASWGHFRTKGTAPFAMFHPLGCQEAPTYFGFAFD